MYNDNNLIWSINIDRRDYGDTGSTYPILGGATVVVSKNVGNFGGDWDLRRLGYWLKINGSYIFKIDVNKSSGEQKFFPSGTSAFVGTVFSGTIPWYSYTDLHEKNNDIMENDPGWRKFI